MTTTMNITKTIMNQIKAIDFWAMGAWGTRNKVSLNETDKRLGGFQFDIKCPKVKNGRVLIELNGLDLYNVTVYRKTRKKVDGIFMPHMPVVKEVENLYAEDLVRVIDGIVG